jgi:sec-independent protein translocase protein TatA
MGGLSWWHWLIILAAFILLFGAKKLPDAARGVGRSLRILKSEVAAMEHDTAPVTPPTAPVPSPPAPTVLAPSTLIPTPQTGVGADRTAPVA